MKNTTLFQRLKGFINDVYGEWSSDAVNGPDTFTTKQMREKIGQYENLTHWKSYYNHPNYVLHSYLHELRVLGCISRVKHGVYRVNAPIPYWFGSMHFSGLKGHLNDPSNLYWNSLPEWQKVNPFQEVKQIRIEDALGGWPELKQHSANVDGSIEQRIATMESTIEEQVTELLSMRAKLAELKDLAKKVKEPKLVHNEAWVTEKWVVEYKDNKFVVTNIDGEWSVRNDTVNNYVADPTTFNNLVAFCKNCE